MIFNPNRYHNHIGKGLRNADCTEFWLNIPKCASNTVSHYLLNKQWKDDKSDAHKFKKIHVFVKDPILRWQGSTLELCYHFFEHLKSQNKYDEFKTWFFHKDFKNFDNNLDLHHVKQKDFMYYCEPKSCVFTIIDSNFDKTIKKIFDIQQDIVHKNTSIGNPVKEFAMPFVKDLLSDNAFIDKLKNFYQDDYELISKIKTQKLKTHCIE